MGAGGRSRRMTSTAKGGEGAGGADGGDGGHNTNEVRAVNVDADGGEGWRDRGRAAPTASDVGVV